MANMCGLLTKLKVKFCINNCAKVLKVMVDCKLEKLVRIKVANAVVNGFKPVFVDLL